MDWLGVRIILKDHKRKSIGTSFRDGKQDVIYYFGESPSSNPYLFDRKVEKLLESFISDMIQKCVEDTLLDKQEIRHFDGYVRIDLEKMVYWVDIPQRKGGYLVLGGELIERKILY